MTTTATLAIGRRADEIMRAAGYDPNRATYAIRSGARAMAHDEIRHGRGSAPHPSVADRVADTLAAAIRSDLVAGQIGR